VDVLRRVLGTPAGASLVAAAIAFGWISGQLLRRAEVLGGAAYDQAYFEQVVWRLGHGYGFSSSFTGGSFLGVHFEPILALPALLDVAWPDARLLSVIHAAALAAAAPCAFLFIRALLPAHQAAPWLAAGLAAPVPFWAEMQEAAVADFHPEAFALPFALLTAWAGLKGRPGWCWAFALLTLSAKEDQAYTLLVVTLLLYFKGPAAIRSHALTLGVGSIVWGALVTAVVMPALRAGSPAATGGYYSWLLTATPTDILLSLYHPGAFLIVLGMLASMAGLPLLAPRWLSLDLPPLAADLLSRHPTQPDLHLHYGLILMLPLLVAGALGARRLLTERPSLPAWACGAVAVPALLVGVGLGRLPPAFGSNPSAFTGRASLSALHRSTDAMPRGAPVAADDNVAVALAARQRLYVIPDAPADSFLVIDRSASLPGYIDRGARQELIDRLPQSGRRLIKDDGRFQVWSPVGG
jgi:uncharacterized membrane protein